MFSALLSMLAMGTAALDAELTIARTLDPRIQGAIALRLVDDGHSVLPPGAGGHVRLSVTVSRGSSSPRPSR